MTTAIWITMFIEVWCVHKRSRSGVEDNQGTSLDVEIDARSCATSTVSSKFMKGDLHLHMYITLAQFVLRTTIASDTDDLPTKEAYTRECRRSSTPHTLVISVSQNQLVKVFRQKFEFVYSRNLGGSDLTTASCPLRKPPKDHWHFDTIRLVGQCDSRIG